MPYCPPWAFETSELISTMCSDILGYPRTLSMTMAPSSHHKYGLASWRNLGSLLASHQVITHKPMVRWRGPIKRYDALFNHLAQRIKKIGHSSSHRLSMSKTPCIILPHTYSNICLVISHFYSNRMLLPQNATPTDAPTVDEWFKWSKQVWESTHQHLEQVA